MGADLTCFMAYDIRGRIPDQLNEEIAFRIAQGYAEFLKPKQVVIGRDIRLSSCSLCDALSKGLMESGVNVFDIGLCGTEEIYFATLYHNMDGGIMVTASHNPIDFNGMKLVSEKARPISGDSGLLDIRRLAEQGLSPIAEKPGLRRTLVNRPDYIRHLLKYVDIKRLKPFKIVVNSGNGCAGPVIDDLEPHLPFEFIKVHHKPDGTFPNGIPNPLLPENRSVTSKAVLSSGADLGIAWDGDFDRCFFFDEKGRFLEGYYIIGLLAEAFLAKKPGGKIIHDPRLTWNTIDVVTHAGGIPIQNKAGHAFMKMRMRSEDAIYGSEMSAHHYFRDFGYCDSGMIPWLLIVELMSQKRQPLSKMLDERIALYPVSGEINRRLNDPLAAIARVREVYETQARIIDETDGISMEMESWRFNLRCSNTEPVLRLNVESKGDVDLVKRKTTELLTLIESE